MVHVHGGLVVAEVVEHVAAVVAEVVHFVERTLYEVCVCSAAAARSWPCSKSLPTQAQEFRAPIAAYGRTVASCIQTARRFRALFQGVAP